MEGKFTITAFTENSPGILHRITVMFTRRKINIESLTVSETERPGVSRFTIVVDSDRFTAEKIVRQIRRIVEARAVFLSENRDLVFKEIAFFKVAADNAEKRGEIEDLVHRYNALVTHIEPQFMVVEKTGREDEINSLFLLLEPLGIYEFVRSGRIAVAKRAKNLIEAEKIKQDNNNT